eukprot:CAMPEP_0202919216 /NCGR_PEP_ID=MMETSP1392-20130828/75321_1 /ASSEMBLY_ACC=CAM_ASM_000868 /TAXON_ID=225041 /ORGANISM="Chlamydomonas chlamydogama, Strain SAG 11-48b" /LENGTH=237 /DNA_ID=CAMNT_0049612501 /DNA_START=466 /DNA_END=1176 /DNA_ORIENTATION=+
MPHQSLGLSPLRATHSLGSTSTATTHSSTSSSTTTSVVPSPAASMSVQVQQYHVPLKRPLLLVSDLDDTIISGPEHDLTAAMLREFLDYNRRTSEGAMCKLVVNTGRTLVSFESVSSEKRHCVPVPDVLVTGVGTRIYFPTQQGWQEDLDWVAHISQGWDVHAVMQVVGQLVGEVGPDVLRYEAFMEQTALKQTLLVRADMHPHVAAALDERLRAHGVQYLAVQGPWVRDRSWWFMD